MISIHAGVRASYALTVIVKGTLLAGRFDVEKERPAPPHPTPVTFPNYERASAQRPRPWSAESASDLVQAYARLRKPGDVTIDHFAALNVTFGEASYGLEALLPAASTGSSYFPSRSLLDAAEAPEPTDANSANRRLSNDRPIPTDRDFYVRLKEIQHRNHDAYCVFTRTPKAGQLPPRLAFFRRFWDGMDNMAYYWDTSLDNYIPPKSDSEEKKTEPESRCPEDARGNGMLSKPDQNSTVPADAEPRKKARIAIDRCADTSVSATAAATDADAKTVQPNTPISSSSDVAPRLNPPSTTSASPKSPPTSSSPSSSATPPTPPARSTQGPPGTYTGYRISTGTLMPPPYRVQTISAFLEPLAWSFGLTLSAPRRPVHLSLQSLRFPVAVSTAVWETPNDRTRARQGWLVGPVLGVCVREETGFGMGDVEAELKGAGQKGTVDLLREVGALLGLAQERTREGREERKPGAGKWWVERPRWGGGAGGELGEGRGEEEVSRAGEGDAGDAEEKEGKEGEREKRARRIMGVREKKKKVSAIDAWKALRPGSGFWDPRVEYKAVGKSKESEWDEVFLVSSLNHHISMLKLRVHAAYLDYLIEGTFPATRPSDPDWCSPQLSRTRWYDLFSVTDREEAMRVVWGVLAYLLRPEDEETEKKAKDVVMGEG
ncbi:hypothetical protein H2201_005051 [Coniosporium apollinis]|uniref:Uncharacterized protein n=1 Tax=Coniosporium apollinis TaxID=61459 RepID=A0ABQ9NR01_9PEZI|nr:hypothetical protein H2201_005051 [Coniosporium apollinis]